jgi:hypothetical protein
MRDRTQLLNGAKADPIGFAECSIDRARLGNAQFSAMN